MYSLLDFPFYILLVWAGCYFAFVLITERSFSRALFSTEIISVCAGLVSAIVSDILSRIPGISWNVLQGQVIQIVLPALGSGVFFIGSYVHRIKISKAKSSKEIKPISNRRCVGVALNILGVVILSAPVWIGLVTGSVSGEFLAFMGVPIIGFMLLMLSIWVVAERN